MCCNPTCRGSGKFRRCRDFTWVANASVIDCTDTELVVIAFRQALNRKRCILDEVAVDPVPLFAEVLPPFDDVPLDGFATVMAWL